MKWRVTVILIYCVFQGWGLDVLEHKVDPGIDQWRDSIEKDNRKNLIDFEPLEAQSEPVESDEAYYDEPAVSVRNIQTGTCPMIITEKQCEQIALSQGSKLLPIRHPKKNRFPRGCYQKKNFGFYFNAVSSTKPCSKTRTCFCNVVHGNWGEWKKVGACSVTCGGGKQVRSRTCDDPKPAFGGDNCKGADRDEIECNKQGCLPDTIDKAMDLCKKMVECFYNKTHGGKHPPGKFYKALFSIMKTCGDEFKSYDVKETKSKMADYLNNLEQALKKLSKKQDYARILLGKIATIFTKISVTSGKSLDDIPCLFADLISKLKEVDLDQIVASKGDVTLMFVMDTTGSMADEINAAKQIATSIINSAPKVKVDYILSPFNDPGTGPTLHMLPSQKENFVAAIGRLRAKGGGDCPEMAIGGIRDALSLSPKYGSPMFLFTDASPKDGSDANVAAVKQLAKQHGTTISFFTRKKPCTTDGNKRYKEIADATGGQLFPIKSASGLVAMTSYISNDLLVDTYITSLSSHKRRVRRSTTPPTNHPITVDDGLKKLIISASTSNAMLTRRVKLSAPSGNIVGPSRIIESEIVYEVASPKPGVWHLKFPDGSGEYRFLAQGISEDPIQFFDHFVYQENDTSIPLLLDEPIKGRLNTMLISVGGLQKIKAASLSLDVIDENGNVLKSDISLKRSDKNVDMFHVNIQPPEGNFVVRLKGTKTSGAPFERTSKNMYQAKTSLLRTTSKEQTFLIKCSGSSITIMLEGINFGGSEAITYKAHARHGSVSPAEQVYSFKQKKSFSISYTPSSNPASCAKSDTITVTAKRRSSGEEFTFNVPILYY